jgi:hypothetical protein
MSTIKILYSNKKSAALKRALKRLYEQRAYIRMDKIMIASRIRRHTIALFLSGGMNII